ncbi:S-adenosylmethionine-dependent methyltransferase [Aspergillus candidus]|uniref:Methyltransferase domain-domain-containing protein n=1 Tax=Aspergillus candidus TaxID=41067 RepID=A0A2I2F9I8_ASPCN|nr:methyltransferase domain-domain-containing protein [Aspergillus candidus]PLB37289.1 methyltransferase domain-domain-containing protein [Aspergillus candidus]
MLPTPDTAHVSFDTVYEPSEDSYLFLDTLSSPSESSWLSHRFSPSTSTSTSTPSPLIVEVGTGSGVVLGFVAANSEQIFGRRDILALGTDVNRNACAATRETAQRAIQDRQGTTTDNGTSATSTFLAPIMADLGAPLRQGSVDVLLFNPPYVPTEELPQIPSATTEQAMEGMSRSEKFDHESYLLSLTYAGGKDGMETTDRLLDAIPGLLHPGRGVAYVLLCRQNRPDEVRDRIVAWGGGWCAESVGSSGKQAGWEKLIILRIWRELP